MRRVMLLLAASAVLVAVGSSASARSVGGVAADGWTMRDLGTFGGTASLAQGINDRGQVVIMRGAGATQAAQTASARSLVFENGRVRWLGTLAGRATVASSINGRGQVAGISVVRGVPHLFLWRNGTMRDLGAAGGNVDGIVYHVVALNDHGEVASTRISKGGAPGRSCGATGRCASSARWEQRSPPAMPTASTSAARWSDSASWPVTA